MSLEIYQLVWLAFIQGITEFLPISSSAHLILPSLLLGWPDQGLTFDVAVHMGTLVAVVFYFQRDIRRICRAFLLQLLRSESSNDARLGWLLIIATVPAGMAGLLFSDAIEMYARVLPIIAATSFVFAGLLLWSERYSSSTVDLNKLSWRQAIFIGFAQALALIPGASRSGVTMTAGLFCNLNKQDAARFSFLLAIPIILASGLLKGLELTSSEQSSIAWNELLLGAGLSAVVALLCIHWFLKLIERIGLMPFVIYRVGLGLMLLIFYLL